MHSPTSKAITENAARWFIRMRSAEADHELHGQFEAWLMADPTHQKEYASFAETMQDLDANEKLTAIADALVQQKHTTKQQNRSSISNYAVKFIVAIFICCAALLSIQQYQDWQTQPILQLATNNPVGKMTTQTLADGTSVTLSANSEMQVTFYRHQRHVQLQRGEAIFEVTKDAQRPFIVETDTTKVTVLGTRFVVNKLSKLVRVSVDHGRVQVESKFPQLSTVVTDGQVVEVKPQQPPNLVQRNALDDFGFAQGKLIFSAVDTDEIADTLSRYITRPVVTQGHSISNISAIINVQNAEQFLQGLPNIAEVNVKSSPEKIVLISKPSKGNTQ